MKYCDLIKGIVDGTIGYSMDTDDVRKLVVLAYYYGRETAVKELSQKVNKVFAEQIERADKCRYRNMAMKVQGDVHIIYSNDYAGDMISTFGTDKLNGNIAERVLKEELI
jgi:hypothetical protein